MNRSVAVALTTMLAASLLAAADREIVKTNWSGFAQQVSSRKLENRKIRITLAAGGQESKTTLVSVSEAALITRSRHGETSVPKEQVRSVRFVGRTGHRGLWGGLAGFGAGIGIGTAIAASQDGLEVSEGPGIIAIPVLIFVGGVGAGVAGYFIGRAMNPQLPEFMIEP